GDVDLLVRDLVAPRAPGPEPIRDHAAPGRPALVGAAGRDDVLHGHARPVISRHEADLGLHLVEAARESEQRAGLPTRDARPLAHLARGPAVEAPHAPTPHPRLASHLDAPAAVTPEVDRTTHPPQVHLLRHCHVIEWVAWMLSSTRGSRRISARDGRSRSK